MCPKSARPTPVADCSAGSAKRSPDASPARIRGSFRGAQMVATLFYLDALPDAGSLAVLSGDEGFHAATVRRIRPGEQLVLGDGAGGLARCVVEQAGRGGVGGRGGGGG